MAAHAARNPRAARHLNRVSMLRQPHPQAEKPPMHHRPDIDTATEETGNV